LSYKSLPNDKHEETLNWNIDNVSISILFGGIKKFKLMNIIETLSKFRNLFVVKMNLIDAVNLKIGGHISLNIKKLSKIKFILLVINKTLLRKPEVLVLRENSKFR